MKPLLRAEDFGAVGDGLTLNTAALQRAIDAAALAGGTLTFAPGVYLSGSLFLKSGVTLQLDLGVTLRGSQALKDYPLMPTRIAGIASGEIEGRLGYPGEPELIHRDNLVLV